VAECPEGNDLPPAQKLPSPFLVVGYSRFDASFRAKSTVPAEAIAATGRQVDLRWMSAYQVRGDELALEHLYFDQAELLGQLGLMPAT